MVGVGHMGKTLIYGYFWSFPSREKNYFLTITFSTLLCSCAPYKFPKIHFGFHNPKSISQKFLDYIIQKALLPSNFINIIDTFTIRLKLTVISRLLVQDVLSVSLSYAHFRPRGMLVIARRGYLSVFGPKIFQLKFLFLSLNLRTESVLPLPLLKFISAHSPPHPILPAIVWIIMLHVRSFGWTCRLQANTHSFSFLSHPCRVIQPYICVCVCMFFCTYRWVL